MIFNSIPNNIRLPFFATEFDSRNATQGAVDQVYRVLVLGQMLPAGTAETLKPYRVSGLHDAKQLFGVGSMLAESIDYYRRVDTITELVAIALPDADASVKAKASITAAGLASVPGAVYCYINGTRLTAGVTAGAEPADVLASLATAINNAGLPVTATVKSEKLVVEFLHAGEVGNDVDIRFNYNTGEAFPTGLAVNATAFTGGAVNPDVGDALAVMSGQWFNGVLNPYLDAANSSLVRDEMERRNGPLVQKEGWAFSAKRGTYGELCAFGEARNNPHEVIPHCQGVPNSPWAFASSVAANAMYYGNIDQARPFQTLVLTGILAPAPEDVFPDFPDSNHLLYCGISTFTAEPDGLVRIGRLITTYKRNAEGAEDTAYLDLNTGLTLSYLRFSLRNYFLAKYPRCKLANDGVLHNQGETIMTPKLAKAECLAWFQQMEKRGLVENAEQFQEELIVERDATNPNRLNFMLPNDLINQLIVFAAQIRFIL